MWRRASAMWRVGSLAILFVWFIFFSCLYQHDVVWPRSLRQTGIARTLVRVCWTQWIAPLIWMGWGCFSWVWGTESPIACEGNWMGWKLEMLLKLQQQQLTMIQRLKIKCANSTCICPCAPDQALVTCYFSARGLVPIKQLGLKAYFRVGRVNCSARPKFSCLLPYIKREFYH